MFEDNNFPREQAVNEVLENFDHEDVQAYLDREHPRHKAVLKEVTEMLEGHFGEEERQGQLDKREGDLRQELYDDERSVTSQLQDIYRGKDKEWSAAYFDSNDPLHNEAVRRVQILSEAKHGNTQIKEVMPIVSRHGSENSKQIAAFIDDRREE